MPESARSCLRIFGVFVLMALTLCLTGCWDIEEVNRRGMANALFLDKGQTHPIKMGASFNVPGSMLPPYSGAEQLFQKRNFSLTGEGSGLLEAFGDMQTNATRAPYLGQLGAIVLSDEFAGENLMGLLDFLGRRMEIPGNTYLLVTGSDPEKLFDLKTNNNFLLGPYLQLYYEEVSRKSQAPPIRLWQVFSVIANGTSDIYMPLIEPSQGQYKIEGLALFSEARLVGTLDGRETNAFALVKGDMERGSLSVPLKETVDRSDSLDNSLVGFFQIASKSKMNPRLDSSGRLSFNIRVEISGSLQELRPRNVTITMADIRKYEQAVAIYAKQEILKVLNKLQRLNSDVIGFGGKVRVKYPRYWEKINWHQEFPKVRFTVQTKFTSQNTGVFR